MPDDPWRRAPVALSCGIDPAIPHGRCRRADGRTTPCRVGPPLEESLPHHMHPNASTPEQPNRTTPAGRAAAWLALAVFLVTASACGSGDEAAEPTSEPTPLVDAMTGEEVEVPADFTLDFDTLPATPTAAAVEPEADGEPTDAGRDAEPTPVRGRGTDGDDDEHPLETIVIDTVVADPDAAPALDEAAALACANTEFAMDALIESSPESAQRFATAADWATQSSYGPVRDLAARLADAPSGARADDLVVTVLETCAAAGYEL